MSKSCDPRTLLVIHENKDRNSNPLKTVILKDLVYVLVAQWLERCTSDASVRGSSPFGYMIRSCLSVVKVFGVRY